MYICVSFKIVRPQIHRDPLRLQFVCFLLSNFLRPHHLLQPADRIIIHLVPRRISIKEPCGKQKNNK